MEGYFKLNNGIYLPAIGFGTMTQFDDEVINNVSFALNHGYKLIDTANRYDNEVAVGNGLKKSGLKREDYFIETKLGPTLYENDHAIDDTLKRLDVDYIDVMILHHPVNNYIYAYKMLEKAYKEGKIKVIGLSNFRVEQIQEILDICEIKPAIMQVEGHPYYPAEHVYDFCKKNDIQLQCWFPLGKGNTGLLEDDVIVSLAKKYHKTPSQIVLRWHYQYGFAAVPGSHSESHIQENMNIYDFELSDEDMSLISTINKHEPIYKVTKESLERLATTKCNFE